MPANNMTEETTMLKAMQTGTLMLAVAWEGASRAAYDAVGTDGELAAADVARLAWHAYCAAERAREVLEGAVR